MQAALFFPLLPRLSKALFPSCLHRGVTFNWHDPATFENAFTVDSHIESIYLLSPPPSADILGSMKRFIDLTRQKSIKRFVFLSSSGMEAGGPAMGKVHKYLIKFINYCRCRFLSWFLGNFITMCWHRERITHKGTIVTGAGDGKMEADDI
ncbi:hypothetical protein BDZ89DRAFT_474626 [Hymenopellis radicata]|nr:hypothetical protein BDZ89DRAFT_474626 [Hymenopellis radicata]